MQNLLDTRKREARTAVEEFYYIHDEVLQEYPGEKWADDEISFCEHLRRFPWALEKARKFDNANDFPEHIRNQGENPG